MSAAQDWEARCLANAAASLGFPLDKLRHKWISTNQRVSGGFDIGPDFDDELTALACIPWVRSVWTFAAHGEHNSVDIGFIYLCDESVEVTIISGYDSATLHTTQGPTLVHACIEAVRASKSSSPEG